MSGMSTSSSSALSVRLKNIFSCTYVCVYTFEEDMQILETLKYSFPVHGKLGIIFFCLGLELKLGSTASYEMRNPEKNLFSNFYVIWCRTSIVLS